MQLNITTDYAIRSLLYLALKDDRANSQEIATAMSIPHRYLTSILRKLQQAGLTSVVRGKDGGYCLRRSTDSITLLEIIEAVEGPLHINRCLEEDQYCSRFATENCPVRNVYCSVQEGIEDMLRKVTLQSLKEKL